MITRNELDSIRTTSIRIKNLSRSREEIRSRLDMAKSFQYKKDVVQETNYKTSRLEDIVAEVDEQVAKIDKKLGDESLKSIRLLNRFYDWLNTIDNPRERDVVELRCVHDLSWEDIGSRVQSNRETVRQMYYAILNKLPMG